VHADDIDFEEELRVALEERASLNPDALTGMEASYRFAGPETMATNVATPREMLRTISTARVGCRRK